MKTIQTYEVFLNESLMKQMEPKSEKDIIDSLNKLPLKEKFEKACEYGVDEVVEEMLNDGYNVKDTEINIELMDDGFSKIVILLLNHGALLKIHNLDLLRGVDLSEIENEMDEEGQYESGDEFETELQDRYEYKLKNYLLSYIFWNNEEQPHNYLELLDTMEMKEVPSKYENYKLFKLKIDKPEWF